MGPNRYFIIPLQKNPQKSPGVSLHAPRPTRGPTTWPDLVGRFQAPQGQHGRDRRLAAGCQDPGRIAQVGQELGGTPPEQWKGPWFFGVRGYTTLCYKVYYIPL